VFVPYFLVQNVVLTGTNSVECIFKISPACDGEDRFEPVCVPALPVEHFHSDFIIDKSRAYSRDLTQRLRLRYQSGKMESWYGYILGAVHCHCCRRVMFPVIVSHGIIVLIFIIWVKNLIKRWRSNMGRKCDVFAIKYAAITGPVVESLAWQYFSKYAAKTGCVDWVFPHQHLRRFAVSV
jgi:hypothetical protein